MSLFGPPNIAKLRGKGNVRGLIKALYYRHDIAEPNRFFSGESYWPIRRDAADALGLIGGARAVEPLIGALKDKERRGCIAAAEALGRIGDPRAVKPLIAALKDMDEGVVEALVQFGAPAVKPLIAALKDEESSIRLCAAKALDKLGWQPDSDELRVVYHIAAYSFTECVAIGAQAVEPLISALKDWHRREGAAEALGQIGDARAVEPLIAALRDKRVEFRRAAAEALGQIGDARAVEPLIASLKDSYRGSLGGAVEALVQFGTPAEKPLIAALKDEASSIRLGAAEALDKLGWQPDTNELRVVYCIAAYSFSECVAIGAPAVEPLITALKDKESSIRSDAAKALGQIGDARAVRPLIGALRDKERRVCRAAAEALGRIRRHTGRGAAHCRPEGRARRCAEGRRLRIDRTRLDN